MGSCAFVTLGCKINQFETQAVREEVLALGYREVPPDEPADVYVVNTCSVTHEAGAKSRRAVLRLARTNPAARIVVMGCSSPEERDQLAHIPQVAVLVGNEEKAMVATFLEAGVRPGELEPAPRLAEHRNGNAPRPAEHRNGNRRLLRTAAPLRTVPQGGNRPRLRVPRRNDPGIPRDAMDLAISRFEGRTRAYIKVQDGCSSFCSFCIIPFLRGLSQSRPLEPVLAEARRLADAGYREIVLTGIHLQDYGGDLQPPSSLTELLSSLAEVARATGLRRIRLSSIGERSFTPEVIELFRDPLFCPHWHIPLQSGDDGVLRLMRRDYTRDEFRATVRLLRSVFDRPSISTDIIVGHPGETERAFESTLDLCREAGFSRIHVFPFSPREGTRSARLPDHVPPPEIGRRARLLRGLAGELAQEYGRRFLGEAVEVLVEGPAAERPGWVEGFSERYMKTSFPAPAAAGGGLLRNAVCRVIVEDVGAGGLLGRLAEPAAAPDKAIPDKAIQRSGG